MKRALAVILIALFSFIPLIAADQLAREAPEQRAYDGAVAALRSVLRYLDVGELVIEDSALDSSAPAEEDPQVVRASLDVSLLSESADGFLLNVTYEIGHHGNRSAFRAMALLQDGFSATDACRLVVPQIENDIPAFLFQDDKSLRIIHVSQGRVFANSDLKAGTVFVSANGGTLIAKGENELDRFQGASFKPGQMLTQRRMLSSLIAWGGTVDAGAAVQLRIPVFHPISVCFGVLYGYSTHNVDALAGIALEFPLSRMAGAEFTFLSDARLVGQAQAGAVFSPVGEIGYCFGYGVYYDHAVCSWLSYRIGLERRIETIGAIYEFSSFRACICVNI